MEVVGDNDTYEAEIALDSNDDPHVPRVNARQISVLRRVFPGRDPLVLECVDL